MAFCGGEGEIRARPHRFLRGTVPLPLILLVIMYKIQGAKGLFFRDFYFYFAGLKIAKMAVLKAF